MYTAEVVYMGGEQFVKERGMEEKDYSRMLKGSETKGLASDRGPCQLGGVGDRAEGGPEAALRVMTLSPRSFRK